MEDAVPIPRPRGRQRLAHDRRTDDEARHERRFREPRLGGHRRRREHEHDDHRHQYSAQRAEHATEQAIDHSQTYGPRAGFQERAQQRAERQHDDEDDQEGDHVAQVRHAEEVLRQPRADDAGEQDRGAEAHDPCGERENLLDDPVDQREQRRADDDRAEHEVEARHDVRAATMPLWPSRFNLSRAVLASSRVA
jgi:hypothetical protein